MQKYVLRFESRNPPEAQEVTFSAPSVQDALEVAKSYPITDWAELYQDGVALCRMQLMDDSGVWLVSRIEQRQ